VLALPRHRGPSPRNGTFAAGALFAAISGTLLVDSDRLALWDGLYFIPIVLVARSVGATAGLAAGGLAFAVVTAWAQIRGVDLGVRGYLARGCAFLVVGGLAGSRTAREREGIESSSAMVDPAIGRTPPSGRDVRHRRALQLAGLGTWELDLATGEMFWSEGYLDLYGVDPHDFVPSRELFQEIVHPEDREILNDALERIIRDGTAVEVRYRITRPSDGAERCIRSHVRRERDPAGKALRLLGTGQDVTDLVMALSPRESEMLMLLAEGLSGEEIAERLVLSPSTVRTHIQNAMAKLGAHTRGQAIATALRSKEIGS
jgi:PAS domain S-box-containing protein